MNTYKVEAELWSPVSSTPQNLRGAREVFTSQSDIDAIRAGVAWVKEQAADWTVYDLVVSKHPLPFADGTGNLNHDYPDEFFKWDMHCLLPLDIFTAAFLQAAKGMAAPAQ